MSTILFEGWEGGLVIVIADDCGDHTSCEAALVFTELQAEWFLLTHKVYAPGAWDEYWAAFQKHCKPQAREHEVYDESQSLEIYGRLFIDHMIVDACGDPPLPITVPRESRRPSSHGLAWQLPDSSVVIALGDGVQKNGFYNLWNCSHAHVRHRREAHRFLLESGYSQKDELWDVVTKFLCVVPLNRARDVLRPAKNNPPKDLLEKALKGGDSFEVLAMLLRKRWMIEGKEVPSFYRAKANPNEQW